MQYFSCFHPPACWLCAADKSSTCDKFLETCRPHVPVTCLQFSSLFSFFFFIKPAPLALLAWSGTPVSIILCTARCPLTSKRHLCIGFAVVQETDNFLDYQKGFKGASCNLDFTSVRKCFHDVFFTTVTAGAQSWFEFRGLR